MASSIRLLERRIADLLAHNELPKLIDDVAEYLNPDHFERIADFEQAYVLARTINPFLPSVCYGKSFDKKEPFAIVTADVAHLIGLAEDKKRLNSITLSAGQTYKEKYRAMHTL
jgi:hypothetical protein